MARVKLGWALLSVPQAIIKAIAVRVTMAKNVDVYPDPNPSLEEVQVSTDQLALAESLTLKGGTDRTVARNARYNELTALMNKMVDYVQLTSGGVAELVDKAGMEVQKDPEPWELPLAVENLKAVPGGNPGTIVLTWDAVTHRKSYVLEMWVENSLEPIHTPGDSFPIPVAGGTWEVVTIQGTRKYVATGLVSGRNYRFRCAAQNSAGMGSYSGEAQSVAR
ncbi:MAG: fibronectin type III domain-containing protein [Flavobacteriales bacterium]|nr:fibronectin type III domain-containing protein [Flavobacteriales bacterium]